MLQPALSRRISLVLPGCVLVAAAPGLGWAGSVDCDAISGGDPIVYGAGGSAQRNLIGRAALVLQRSDDPIYVVYKDDGGACSGINAMTGVGATLLTGSAYYWDTDTGSRVTCNLPLSGVEVDFASMGNGPLLCPLITDLSLVDGIIDVTSGVSTVNLVVPNASSQQVISSEAAYLVYGFGAEADVAPWNNPDPAYYIRRDENSYVQQYIALATGLPLASFYGVDAVSNSNSITLLSGLADPEQGIGFVSGEVADANRASVRTLAYQHVDQNVGYWPDSSATAFDKINVRNGLYYLWGPGHFYAFEGPTPGSYENESVQVLVEYLIGASEPAGATESILDVLIDNKNIPLCAMRVTRDEDLGPIYAYQPDEPCGCYFDFKATGSTTCETCDTSNPCSGSGVCRHGFCEDN